MNPHDFAVMLYRGEFDEFLDGMIYTIQEYKKSKAPKIWEFGIGDIVRLNNQTRPKYLQGKTAKVVKVNRSKIVIKIDDMEPYAKYAGNVTVPLSLVEKV